MLRHEDYGVASAVIDDLSRHSRSGLTTLSDIEALANPAQAPQTLHFSGSMTATFDMLRQQSFPRGRSMERGGTIVADKRGALSLQNIGGHASFSDAFAPSYDLEDSRNYKAIGVFHTHPYDRTEGSMTGMSFSGGDIGALISAPVILAVVQSGPRLFALIKTALTPKEADQAATRAAVRRDVIAHWHAGGTIQQGSRIVMQQYARRYNLAYYQGTAGIVHKV